MKKIYTLTLIFGVVFSISNSYALNSEEALVESCKKFVKDPIPEDTICYEYVNGFIDGAVITDSAIVNNIKKEKKELSPFFERAYKTRLGISKKELPATYYAKFCLPEDKSRHDMVEELVHAIDPNDYSKSQFKDILYETLKRIYKCEI